jgi:tRNA (guanine-N7-)-methyltransferase
MSILHLATETSPIKRPIRSYVLRSRMTLRQEAYFEQLWPHLGINACDGQIDFCSFFARNAPIILEIGFGMGESLVTLAANSPHLNFLGIDVHKPGVSRVLAAIQQHKISNLRIMSFDAVTILRNNIASNSLRGVLLFFPDPWPKRRHHKRRIVQPAFVDLVYQKLQPKGYFHLATDIQEYASHMRRVINEHPGFTLTDKENCQACLQRPKTKFERKGERLGQTISDLIYIKDAH